MPRMSRLSFPEGPPPEVFLGRAVRDRRQALGLSQEQLAAACDLDRSFLGEIDRGRRNVTLPTLFRLAVGLQTTPGALLDEAYEALRDENAWFDAAVRRGQFEPRSA